MNSIRKVDILMSVSYVRCVNTSGYIVTYKTKIKSVEVGRMYLANSADNIEVVEVISIVPLKENLMDSEYQLDSWLFHKLDPSILRDLSDLRSLERETDIEVRYRYS